jgi:DNA mismatch repair protein MutH
VTWTYDNTSLASNLAQVRLALGATNTNDQLLTDEEIAAASGYTAAELAATSGVNIPLAAYRAVDAMLAAVTRKIDTSGPRFGATRSQIFQHFRDLKAELRARSKSSASPVEWSEHSVSDAEAIESNTDFAQPAFTRGRFDNPDA